MTLYTRICCIQDDRAEVITGFPTDASILGHIFALTFIIVLTLSTIILNGVTVITIWRSKSLKQRPSNFAILLQSSVDLANGVLVMPLVTARVASELTGRPNCVIAFILKKSGMLIFFYTLTTLSAMNFDRYLGVLHPFSHLHLVTNERILRYVVSLCIFQSVVQVFTVTHNEITRPVLITTALLFVLYTVFVYSKMFLRIRVKNRLGVSHQSGECTENGKRDFFTKKCAKKRHRNGKSRPQSEVLKRTKNC